MSDGEGFLSRWSRRKRSEPEQPAPVPPPANPPAEEEELPPDELALLPSLEEITAETDIAGFLRRGVPAPLRNAALRLAWAADPAVRDRVGDALDYAWDYNTPGGAPGYGPLEPGIDVAGMVSRMFSRSPDEPAETPVEAVADSQESPSEADEGAVASSGEAVTAEPLALAAAVPSDEAERLGPEPAEVRPAINEPSPHASRRRHGGAMPL